MHDWLWLLLQWGWGRHGCRGYTARRRHLSHSHRWWRGWRCHLSRYKHTLWLLLWGERLLRLLLVLLLCLVELWRWLRSISCRCRACSHVRCCRCCRWSHRLWSVNILDVCFVVYTVAQARTEHTQRTLTTVCHCTLREQVNN